MYNMCVAFLLHQYCFTLRLITSPNILYFVKKKCFFCVVSQFTHIRFLNFIPYCMNIFLLTPIKFNYLGMQEKIDIYKLIFDIII